MYLTVDVFFFRKRVRSLLDNLRVPASLRVFSLASGQITSYECIVRGKETTPTVIEKILGGDVWWEALKSLRKEDEKRRKEANAKKNRPQPVPSSSSSTPRKQSKKDKRQMGVSLPKEHLEFFKRNMQIGLAHPRSSNRRRSEEIGQDSESEYEDSDSGSDLSGELAALDLEDIAWINSESPGNGLRRSQTFSTGGKIDHSTRGLQRRATGAMGNGRGGRYSSRLSNPQEEPSIQSFLGRRSSDTTDLASSYGSLSTTPRPGMFQKRSPSGHPSTIEEGGESSDTDRDGTLKASDRAKLQSRLQAGEHTRHRSSSASSLQSSTTSESEVDEDKYTSPAVAPSNQVELPFVSFNSLPNKAQYLILK